MTISAKIVADSISPTGVRLTTFELEYPRFIHSELLTHRVFSRNAASSRAIPVSRAIELIKGNTAMPIHWGKNQPGMSAKEECNETFPEYIILLDDDGNPQLDDNGEYVYVEYSRKTREDVWNDARDAAIRFASMFNEKGYHKQIVNRLLEPFTHIKVVLTATELDNWFWLRNHKDAQPEIAALAQRMAEALDNASHGPRELKPGQWHVPYYGDGAWIPVSYDGNGIEGDWLASGEVMVDKQGNTLADALAISSSCCAQVSYRRLDDSLDKARDIFHRLVESMPPHFSPFEHQASPMVSGLGFEQTGVTHLDRYGNYWSGNFRGWVQHRQLIMDRLNIQHMTSSIK